MMENSKIPYTSLHLALGERLLELFGLHYQYTLANRCYEIRSKEEEKLGAVTILPDEVIRLHFQMPYGEVTSQIDFHGHEQEKNVFQAPFQFEGEKNQYSGAYLIPLYFKEEAKGLSLKIKSKEGELLKSLEINHGNSSLILRDYENEKECQIISIDNNKRKIIFDSFEKGEQKIISSRNGCLEYYEEDELKEFFPKVDLSKNKKYKREKTYVEEKMPHFYETIASFENTLTQDGISFFPRAIALCYENYRDGKVQLCIGKQKKKLPQEEVKRYFPMFPGHLFFAPQYRKRKI